MLNNLEIAKDYARNVISNRIASSKYVKNACLRFLDDLDREDLYYDGDAVDELVRFYNEVELINTKPRKYFILESWQIFIIANIFGLKYRESELRKYRFVHIEIPRKNGKSFFVNVLAIYHLIFGDDEEILVSANSREQAKLTSFKQLKAIATQLDPKNSFIKQYYNSLKCRGNDLTVTAAESGRLDGLNPSLAIIDEIHSAKDSGMYEVMKSGMGNRDEPLLITITTAGFDKNGFGYTHRDYIIKVLQGDVIDDSQFGLIYCLDDEDEIDDETNWFKANPNLGVSLKKIFIKTEVNKALNNPLEASGVKVKNFNIWLQGNVDELYIDSWYIDKASQKFEIEDIVAELRETNDYVEVYVGMDLSKNSDFSALSVMFVYDNKLWFKNYYYLPEQMEANEKQKKWYIEMNKLGYINLNQGNIIDYNMILTDILNIQQKYFINSLAYDPYNATHFAIELLEHSINAVECGQGAKSIAPSTAELYRLLITEQVIIDDNPVTKWMFNNAVVDRKKDYLKTKKSADASKIDGVHSMLNALAAYLASPRYTFNVH